MTPTTYFIGLFLLLPVAGCALSHNEAVSGPLQGGTVVIERLPPATQEPGAPSRPFSIDTPGGSVIIERLPPLPEVVPEVPVASAPPVLPEAPIAAPVPETRVPEKPVTAAIPDAAPVPTRPVAVPDKPTVKPQPPVKPAAPVAQAPTPPKPVAAKARAATLDLDALEQRLKDTDAIGVFTKIALKNQVDELLKGFKAYHDSDGKPALSQLRQSYDKLLQKVNDVLKSGDPSLAGEIMGSREAIWGLLSDPVKFAKL